MTSADLTPFYIQLLCIDLPLCFLLHRNELASSPVIEFTFSGSGKSFLKVSSFGSSVLQVSYCLLLSFLFVRFHGAGTLTSVFCCFGVCFVVFCFVLSFAGDSNVYLLFRNTNMTQLPN